MAGRDRASPAWETLVGRRRFNNRCGSRDRCSNGGEVTEKGRTFVRTLGKSTDDAGHGVGAEFGGGSEYDSLWEGNLFPIDPRTNQNGGYRQAEKLVEDYHYSGYTVCSHIEFIYDATSKRPDRPTAMNWMILAYHPGLDDVQQSMVPVTNP